MARRTMFDAMRICMNATHDSQVIHAVGAGNGSRAAKHGTWLTSLVCCPAPAGPMWLMFFPMHWNSGSTRSNASLSLQDQHNRSEPKRRPGMNNRHAHPPTMMASRASRAPISPPDTGASATHESAMTTTKTASRETGPPSAAMPFLAASAAMSLASEGSEVVMSTTTPPGRCAASTPLSPRIT